MSNPPTVEPADGPEKDNDALINEAVATIKSGSNPKPKSAVLLPSEEKVVVSPTSETAPDVFYTIRPASATPADVEDLDLALDIPDDASEVDANIEEVVGESLEADLALMLDEQDTAIEAETIPYPETADTVMVADPETAVPAEEPVVKDSPQDQTAQVESHKEGKESPAPTPKISVDSVAMAGAVTAAAKKVEDSVAGSGRQVTGRVLYVFELFNKSIASNALVLVIYFGIGIALAASFGMTAWSPYFIAASLAWVVPPILIFALIGLVVGGVKSFNESRKARKEQKLKDKAEKQRVKEEEERTRLALMQKEEQAREEQRRIALKRWQELELEQQRLESDLGASPENFMVSTPKPPVKSKRNWNLFKRLKT